MKKWIFASILLLLLSLAVACTPTPEHTHAFGEWETVTASTCTADGEEQRVCACGEAETRPIAAQHTPNEAVSCTEAIACTVCGVELSAAPGHDFVEYACTRCDETLYSKGLDLVLSDDELSYAVAGMGSCTDVDLIIPARHEGKPVTVIGREAFKAQTALRSVSVPDGIVRIDDRAFLNCSGMTTLNLAGSVASIGRSAFSGCSSLTSLTLPEGVTKMDYQAFYRCSSLTTVTVPNSLVKMGLKVFGNCDQLQYTVYQGCKYLGNADNPHVLLVGVESTEITSVSISDTTVCIGGNAFSSCEGLTSVTIPEGIAGIGDSAFRSCRNLTSVTVPTTLRFIGNSAFATTDVTHLYISDLAAWCAVELENVTGHPFDMRGGELYLNGTPVTELTIPEGVGHIGSHVFYGCYHVTTLTVPEGLTDIGAEAFGRCSRLTSVTLPSSLSYVGEHAFPYNSNTLQFTVKNGVRYLGNAENPYVLLVGPTSNTVTTTVIMSGTRVISPHAYEECEQLLSVTIPEGVVCIGDSAFSQCWNLATVKVPESATYIGYGAFSGCNALCSIFIPRAAACFYVNVIPSGASLVSVYFGGTAEEAKPLYWEIKVDSLPAIVYLYSENEPTAEGRWWHWVNGMPQRW